MYDGYTIEHKVIKSMITSVRVYNKVIDSMTDTMGCHHAQHKILFFLNHRRQKNKLPTQKEIADFFEISPACVAATMKKMEKNGIIERSADKTDSRANVIKITKKGEDMINKSMDCFTYIERQTLKNFSTEELNTLADFFYRIKNNLSEISVEDYRNKEASGQNEKMD